MWALTYYFLLFVSAYAATVLLLLALSNVFPRAEFYARLLVSQACLILCASYGVVASVVLRAVGYGGLSQWTVAKAFKWSMWLSAGVSFVLQGEENLKTRPAVLIANHQTELDVLMLGAVFPPYTSVTSKKSLRWVPFLGWFMTLSKTVFIDRGNRESAKATFDTAAKTMNAERQNVFIFVEGTRSYTSKPEMLPFKKGAFHLAIQAKVPIIPIVVANYSNVLHVQSRTFTTGCIPVKVLPPIPTDNLTAADVDSLTQSTRESMLKELLTLTEIARSQNIAVPPSQADAANSKKAKKLNASGLED